ncbi:MAG: hypothetical protein AAF211_03265 [Myxococcota bacterium]
MFLVLCLSSAQGQIDPDVTEYLKAPSGEVLGRMVALVGLEGWDWYDQAWPTSDFLTSGDAGPHVSPTADRYDNPSFDPDVLAEVPSASSSAPLYQILTCSEDLATCRGVGFLKVEDEGDILHWYMDPESRTDRFVKGRSEVFYFEYLAETPTVEPHYRYLAVERWPAR